MPAIPLSYTTVRPQTSGNLVLDTGVVYVNLNETVLRTTGSFISATAASGAAWTDPNGNVVNPVLLGATEGGNVIKFGKKERTVKVDGMKTPYKGLDRIDMFSPTLETSLLEMGDSWTMSLALGASGMAGDLGASGSEGYPGGSVTEYIWPATGPEPVLGAPSAYTSAGPVLYNELVPGLIVSPNDYIGNVAIAATVARSSLPVIYVLRNVRVVDIGDLNLKNDSELVCKVVFKAHSLLSAPSAVPISLYFPVITGS